MPELALYSDNEKVLQQIKNGDKQAKEEFIKNNMGLVRAIVKKFSFSSADEDDLFQIGCVGLLKATERFDAAFGVKFSTYAVPVILGEIKRYLRDDGTVKVSRRLKELSFLARRESEAYLKKNGREISILELSKILDADPDELIMSLSSALPVESLSAPLLDSDENFTLENLLFAADSSEQIIDKLSLKEILSSLPLNEQKLIHLRYFKGRTQSESAKILNTSQVQISRLEKKILSHLREIMIKSG